MYKDVQPHYNQEKAILSHKVIILQKPQKEREGETDTRPEGGAEEVIRED